MKAFTCTYTKHFSKRDNKNMKPKQRSDTGTASDFWKTEQHKTYVSNLNISLEHTIWTNTQLFSKRQKNMKRKQRRDTSTANGSWKTEQDTSNISYFKQKGWSDHTKHFNIRTAATCKGRNLVLATSPQQYNLGIQSKKDQLLGISLGTWQRCWDIYLQYLWSV